MLRILRVLCGAILLTAVACGGDDGGDQLTKAELIEQGDGICADAVAALEEVDLTSDRFGDEEEQKAFLAGLDEGIEITETRLERFRDLTPPEEDQETFDRLVELQEKNLDNIREYRAAVEDGDTDRANDLLNESTPARDEAKELAAQYGFEVCGVQ